MRNGYALCTREGWLTKSGHALLEQAEALVGEVRATEAARAGRPGEPESDTADAVAAWVGAFRELKNVADDEVPRENRGRWGQSGAGSAHPDSGVLPI